MSKLRARTSLAAFALLAVGVWAQEKAPLALMETIPLPGLHDGNFDHFAVDLQGHRLFLTAEDNSAVEVFDLRASKLVHTISDIKKPHAIVYRAALKKLFVVDGFAKSLKCVSRTDPVGPQILIDVSFNQEMPMRTLRACQDTQCGQARPEPAHSSSRISPHEHTL